MVRRGWRTKPVKRLPAQDYLTLNEEVRSLNWRRLSALSKGSVIPNFSWKDTKEAFELNWTIEDEDIQSYIPRAHSQLAHYAWPRRNASSEDHMTKMYGIRRYEFLLSSSGLFVANRILVHISTR